MNDQNLKRVGFIGVGEQGWNNLLPALALLPYVDVVGICDSCKQRRAIAAEKYGANPYEDYNEMISKENLDAVVVASHPRVHEQVLLSTIPKKIPTFVEKPPTLSTQSLNRIVELNRNYNTETAIGLNFGYTEPLRFVFSAVADPDFGKLSYLRVEHLNNKPSKDLWFKNNLIRDFLLSQIIHALGVIFDFGDPLDESEEVHTRVSENGILVCLNKQMKAKNGGPIFTAELISTSSSPFFDWSLEAVSDLGNMIRVNSLLEVEVYSHKQCYEFTKTPKWWRGTWRPSPMSSGYKRTGYQYEFANFFRQDESAYAPVHTIENALEIYKVMDRIEEGMSHG